MKTRNLLLSACCLLLAAACGCSTATPASRATTATYGDIYISLDDAARHNTVRITIGDGALASADSAGSTETQTATPTTDVKPDVNVNYAQGGGIANRAPASASPASDRAAPSALSEVFAKLAGTLSDEGLAALKAAIANKTNGSIALKKKDGSTISATCENGKCTLEDGSTLTAEDCAACSDK